WPAPASACIGFCEDAVALQVDDLLGFRDRKRNRIFPALVRIGADESVFLHTFRGVFLDDPGSLIDAVVPIRGRADSVALVFHGRRRRFFAPAKGSPGEPAPCRFELRKHGSYRCHPRAGSPIDYRAPAPACRPLSALGRLGARGLNLWNG